MPLRGVEAPFAEAVRRDFRFLVTDHGFGEKPVAWDGHGISVNHHGRALEISNYLEGGKAYTTLLFPLREGARLPTFDGDMDETFSHFSIDDLLSTDRLPSGVASGSFPTQAELLAAVAARAAVLHEYIGTLLNDDGSVLATIRDRKRERHLRELVPRWLSFVEQVRSGYGAPGPAYVAGVNTRGAIRSLLSWPGKVPADLERALREADAKFDDATEPITLEPGAVRVLPHPRATRWFRRPKGGGSLVGTGFA